MRTQGIQSTALRLTCPGGAVTKKGLCLTSQTWPRVKKYPRNPFLKRAVRKSLKQIPSGARRPAFGSV